MMKQAAIGFGLWLVASPAAAEVSVTFRDGAPKDQFVISSRIGLCTNAPAEIAIDLGPSVGQAIFDITERGSGVEVYQPFELVAGGDIVTGTSDVSDGDTVLTLALSSFGPDAQVAFTIDIDDTLGPRGITVNGSEIAGAVVTVRSDGETASGVFAEDGLAVVSWPVCLS